MNDLIDEKALHEAYGQWVIKTDAGIDNVAAFEEALLTYLHVVQTYGRGNGWQDISTFPKTDSLKLARHVLPNGEYDYDVCSTWEYADDQNHTEWLQLPIKPPYAAGNPQSHKSAPSDADGASPGSSQGDGSIATPAAPDALQTLVNHPIAQAHGLTGRECKELLKALRTTEPMSSEPPYEPGIVGIGNKLLREVAIKAILNTAKEQGAQFNVTD